MCVCIANITVHFKRFDRYISYPKVRFDFKISRDALTIEHSEMGYFLSVYVNKRVNLYEQISHIHDQERTFYNG